MRRASTWTARQTGLALLGAAIALACTPTAAGSNDRVSVPAGEFWFGCNEEVDPACGDDEKPGRKVHVDAFEIDRTEVTVAEFAACVDAGACDGSKVRTKGRGDRDDGDAKGTCNWGKSGREQHPINCVDWHQANAYCTWAGGRLPTEREWEKAARGVDGRRFPWGNERYAEPPRRANIKNVREAWEKPDRWEGIDAYDDGYEATAPVGSYPEGASPYGALDMMGNVWEWTSSKWAGDKGGPVLRGASYANSPFRARASERHSAYAIRRMDVFGFRCARSP